MTCFPKSAFPLYPEPVTRAPADGRPYPESGWIEGPGIGFHPSHRMSGLKWGPRCGGGPYVGMGPTTWAECPETAPLPLENEEEEPPNEPKFLVGGNRPPLPLEKDEEEPLKCPKFLLGSEIGPVGGP